jgi:glycosyltransferase involved in cell wall biosynthesis
LDKQIILFVADSVDDRRKGFDLFEQAIQVMQNEVLVCIMGKKDKRLKILEKSSVKELGHISDEILLSKIYTSASLFVCASRMDNLPNTIMESLCCGTPVVAFRTGGIPEMIINEENGILANAIDVKNLREAIERALKMKFDRQAISKKASEKYSMNRQSNEVYGVYQKILTSKVF